MQHVEASKRHFGPSLSMRNMTSTPTGHSVHYHEPSVRSHQFDNRDEDSMADVSLADPFAPSRSGTPTAFATSLAAQNNNIGRSMSPAHTVNTATSKSRVTSWADSTIAGTVTSGDRLGAIAEARSSPNHLDEVTLQQIIDEHPVQPTTKHTSTLR